MTFVDFIKAGYVVNINTDGTEYDPCKFWMEDGKLFSESPALGRMERTDIIKGNIEYLNTHFRNMMEDGLKIEIWKGATA